MKVSIVTHVYATGPAQDLRDYLNERKNYDVVFIGHPLFYSSTIKGHGNELYKNGQKVGSRYFNNTKIHYLVSYVISFILTIYYGIMYMRKTDVYIGCNNLNALDGLILRFLGITKKCVYYVIDYNPNRFENKIVNKIFHKVDQFCVKHCDETWNLSPRMEEGREKYFGFTGGNQKIVPVGVWLDRIRPKSIKDIEKHTAVFVGHLIEKQGVQHIINSINLILKKLPDFKLVIVGKGDYRPQLEEIVANLGLQKHVVFRGYIESHADLEEEISQYGVAVALYNKYEANGNLTFTHFADPAKLKTYLACGLPILLTAVSHNAQEIQNRECGLIVSPDPKSISHALIYILEDENVFKKFKRNALEYAKEFNWPYIFGNLGFK